MLPGNAVLAVLAASLLFSTTGTAQALANVDGSPWAIGAARLAFGGTLLALIEVVMIRARRRGSSARAGIGAALPRARRDLRAWATVGVGSVGILAYQPTFFAGTRANGVAIGTVLAIGSSPILTGALAALRGHGRPERTWLIATAASLAGVTLLSGVFTSGETGGATRLTAGGVCASLGAGLAYSVYTLAAKEVLEMGWAPGEAMAGMFGGAGLLSMPALAFVDLGWLGSPAGLLLIGWLGAAPTCVAYLLFGWGLARLPARTVATLTLGEPLGAALLGIVVLGERLSTTAVVGMAFLGGGLALLATGVGRGARARR